MTQDDTPGTDAKAPDRDKPRGGAALLIVDMINRFDFEGGELLQPKALAAADAILGLRTICETAGYPVIYVNDNFGEWHSEKSRLVERALSGGNDIVAKLRPRDDDYFVIKAQFSGFYASSLPVLLPKLGASRLILTGVATDICVLFTAADAHMRDYALWVPQNCVAAEHDERGEWALSIMRNSMGAETAAAGSLDPAEWMRRLDAAGVQ